MRCGRYSNCRRRWCIGSGALAARSRKQPDRRRPPAGIDVVFRNAALADLALLDIATDPDTDADGWTTTLHLAECFRLTLYDAVYVELAHRRSLTLASLDEELRAAARTLGVPVLGTAA
jgi:predicted nucleic acid-binding protein